MTRSSGQPGDRAQTPASPALDAQAEMLANRLRKRVRHLRKWARREGVTCYRLYDRDIPEIPLAIDWYEGHLHIAQYRRARDEDDATSAAWRSALASAAARALEVAPGHVHVKERRRQSGTRQYSRLAESDDFLAVSEGGHRFWVNLHDYLDTGLFLDHRQTRARVAAEARGARFLNLFAYTGAFTVYAAAGGARSTTSVDLSPRYLAWARRNLVLNGLDGPAHRLVRADVIEFLRSGGAATGERFDLAVLDPPTFSNSKKMHGVMDLERDHAALIDGTLALLRPGGVLYFSTSTRRVRLDERDSQAIALGASAIEDITAETVPLDFDRRLPHRCYRIVK